MTFKLPTPYYPQWSHSNEHDAYTAEQLLQVRRDALEEAAKVCRTLADKGFDVTYENADSGAYACEEAIHKLKEQT